MGKHHFKYQKNSSIHNFPNDYQKLIINFYTLHYFFLLLHSSTFYLISTRTLPILITTISYDSLQCSTTFLPLREKKNSIRWQTLVTSSNQKIRKERGKGFFQIKINNKSASFLFFDIKQIHFELERSSSSSFSSTTSLPIPPHWPPFFFFLLFFFSSSARCSTS